MKPSHKASKKQCRWPECEQKIQVELLWCGKHWEMIPLLLRDDLFRHGINSYLHRYTSYVIDLWVESFTQETRDKKSGVEHVTEINPIHFEKCTWFNCEERAVNRVLSVVLRSGVYSSSSTCGTLCPAHTDKAIARLVDTKNTVRDNRPAEKPQGLDAWVATARRKVGLPEKKNE